MMVVTGILPTIVQSIITSYRFLMIAYYLNFSYAESTCRKMIIFVVTILVGDSRHSQQIQQQSLIKDIYKPEQTKFSLRE